MHASRARSLKRDDRDRSPSMKQPAVVPSALARGSQPAALPDGLWYRPSSDSDLAVLACINYTYRTVSKAFERIKLLTAHCHVSKSLDFYFDKAWRLL